MSFRRSRNRQNKHFQTKFLSQRRPSTFGRAGGGYPWKRTHPLKIANQKPSITSMAKKVTTAATFAKTWALSSAATLGSLVRGTGILLELRARLPFAWRKSLNLTGGSLILAMPEGSEDDFGSAAVAISHALEAIESLPVIPREIEDILAISTSERRRWLDDGRLPNAGTRTVIARSRTADYFSCLRSQNR